MWQPFARWTMDDTTKNLLEIVDVELSVMLGQTHMPVHQLLRMGRGAVIELDTADNDEVLIYVNNTPVAKGEVIIKSDRIAISITKMLKRSAVEAGLF
mgnify:CR=1 FL=1